MAAPDDLTPILHGSDDNPVPNGATVGRLTARDGVRLRYAVFKGQAQPLNGTVVLLTGRNECIEKYYETIRDLQARGRSVAIMDWRGQGGSDRLLRDRQKGYVVSFDAYVHDLEQFFDEIVLPDCRPPFHFVAHSTGGLVALLAAPVMHNRIGRIVLSAPLLELSSLPLSTRNTERVVGLLYWLGLGQLYFGGGKRPPGGAPFEGNVLTSDPARYARNQAIYDQAPDLELGGPTIAWVRAAGRAALKAAQPKFMAQIHTPILMIAAGADRVVANSAIERYAYRLRSASVLTIDGARHELLQERDRYREQFLAALEAFLPPEETFGADQEEL